MAELGRASDDAGAIRAALAIDPLDASVAARRIHAALFDSRPPARRVGGHALVEPIGRGAHGTVWSAVQLATGRRIALKFVDHPCLELRREAQAMARINDPNVVTVFEVGGDDERPFIAMEYVDGCSLAQWLAGPPRRLDEILDVFTQAARGLDAAHRAGLVHRDFKPANVLVGRDGRVRVGDFGLALPRALATGGAGTPSYMAPEQHLGAPVDPRSDQYSFCVALYEAVHGQRPIEGSDDAALRRAVLAGTRTSTSAFTPPSWLTRLLDRGLSRDPAARHPDMACIASALAHGRASQTRGRRWAIAALLVAGTLAPVIATREPTCRDADARVDALLDPDLLGRAEARFAGTSIPDAGESWRRVELGLDEHARAWAEADTQLCHAQRPHDDATAALARCVDARGRELRAFVTVLADADADVVRNSPLAVAQIQPLRRCVAAERQAPAEGEPSRERDDIREQLAHATALWQAGKLADAHARASAALHELGDTAAPELRAALHVRLGRILEDQGHYAAAGEELERAVWTGYAARDEVSAASAASRLVYLTGYLWRDTARGRWWSRLAEALERRAPPDALARADRLAHVSAVALASGDLAQALDLAGEVVTLRRAELGDDHVEVARALSNLGVTLDSLGRYDEAIEVHERALAIREAALGEDHHLVATSLDNLGYVRMRVEQLDRAEAEMQRALRIRSARLGPDHPTVAISLANLASVAQRRGRGDEAIALLEQALAIESAVYGPDHGSVLALHRRIADARPTISAAP